MKKILLIIFTSIPLLVFPQCGTVNGLKEGHCITFHENGNKRSDLIWKKGMLDGQAIFYYESGEKRAEGRFKKDYKIGEWVYYNKNGKFDYYDIGGRWQDGLRTMMNGTIVKCNNCKIKDLYLKSTKSEKEELTRKWNFIVNGIDDGLDFDNKDDCKVNREYIKTAFLRDYVTLETYINSITINPPTAIVSSEDEWIELDELTEKERCEEFLNHLKKGNPEHYIHVVDIHE